MVIDVKCKLVITHQELVMDTIHGQWLQRIAQSLHKVELWIEEIGKVTTDVEVFWIDNLKSFLANNVDLGFQKVDVARVCSNVKVLYV